MTIQEAIRSGKKYRRKGQETYFAVNCIYYYRPEDILADDWEIERGPREIYVMENKDGEFYSFSEKVPNIIEQQYSTKIVKFREVIE